MSERTNSAFKQTHEQIQSIVSRIQDILRQIGGSEQPASQLEIAELKALGEAYAKLTEQLTADPDRQQT